MNPDHLDRVLNDLTARHPLYAAHRAYIAGRHRAHFDQAKWEGIFGQGTTQPVDNLMPTVVESLTDRLTLEGFELASDVGGLEGDAHAETIWERLRLAQHSGRVHDEAAGIADAYVVVSTDEQGQAVVRPMDADEVTVVYDPTHPDRIQYAGMVWRIGTGAEKRVRVAMFYPDRTEHYATEPSAYDVWPQNHTTLQPWSMDEEGGNVVPNPMGKVPVFHFANGKKQFGTSEIAQAIALQDALNRSLATQQVVGHFLAWPQRWATGIDDNPLPVLGETAEDNELAPGVLDLIRDMLVSSEPGAKFGQFDAASPSAFIEEQKELREEIMRVTRTPRYLAALDGEPPSGRALLVADSPLTAKASQRCERWGNVWEDVLAFCVQVERSHNLDGSFRSLAPAPVLNARWADVQRLGEADRLELAEAKLRVGYSKRQVLIELGKSEEEAARIIAEANTDRASRGEAALALFDAGAEAA